MGDVATHFSRHEFACKCGCGFDAVDIDLLDALSDAREHFGAKIIIHSACRCPAHNRAIGGSKRSQHMHAKAADIEIEGVPPDVVADYFEWLFPNSHGIGRYDTFTHIDVRTPRARWDKRG